MNPPISSERFYQTMKKKLMAVFVSAALLNVICLADSPAYKEKYSGGSLADIKTGDSIKIGIDGDKISLSKRDTTLATIPASAVTELSYGQDVHRRVGTAIGLAVISFGAGALMMFAKSKKHFIGLTWDDAGKKGGIAIQADKNDYRGLLSALEGLTGKKAVNADAMTVKN
jgi:hypothetical protein